MTHAATILLMFFSAGVIETGVDPPPPVPTLAVAAELGITPKSLIVSGVAGADFGEVQGILGRIDDAVSWRQAIASARIGVESAATELQAVRRSLLLEPVNPDLLAQIESIASELALHTNAIAAARDALLDTALDSIPQESAALLTAWAECSDLPVPGAFRASIRSADEWAAIVRALRAEARALRTGAPMEHESSVLLATVRAEPAVVVAEYALAQLDEQVELAFAAFAQN